MIPSTTPRAMNSARRLLADNSTPRPLVALIVDMSSLLAGATSSAESVSGAIDASAAVINNT